MASKTIHTFFRNRAMELLGLLFISLGIFLMVALSSYDVRDPSWNHATDNTIRNLAGVPGAYVAVPLLEFFGLAAFLLAVVPIGWGWRILVKNGLSKLWLRITAFALAIPAMATLFTFIDQLIDTPPNWPALSFGGYVGNFIDVQLSPHITLWGLFAAAALAGLPSLLYTIALSKEQWLGAYKAMILPFKLLKRCFMFLVRTKTSIERFVEGSEYEGGQEPAIINKPEKSSPTRTTQRRIVTRAPKTASVEEAQTSFEIEMRDNYQLPPFSLLESPRAKQKNKIAESALSQNAVMLEKVLEDYGVQGNIVEVQPGPVVTLYALEPAAGTKSSRVIGLADDIARSMSASSARIAVIPGRNAIGIELPNSTRETVYLKELLKSESYKSTKHSLPLTLGKDISGEPEVIDLAKTPHMLIAGTTGSGKSVGINAMILSLLYKFSPNECKFIMIDPKMLELSIYQDIPHLLTPVVTEPSKAVVALKWVVREMENRYRLMSHLGVRNISGYNKKIEDAKDDGKELHREVQTGFNPDTGAPVIEQLPIDMNPLPYIVVIVDEMADLMMVAGKDIEASVQRLAQMARAAGIHVILATQRPSVDVITGVIKANFPTRISYQVSSKIDSRTIIGEAGAEQLLGMGDLLYMAGGSRIKRLHGPFVADGEVEKVVNFLKKQGEPSYIEEVTTETEEDMAGFESGDGSKDSLYDQAVAIVLRDKKASTSYIQRQLKIGYNRAANIIDEMEQDGVISAANHVGKREVLVNS